MNNIPTCCTLLLHIDKASLRSFLIKRCIHGVSLYISMAGLPSETQHVASFDPVPDLDYA